MSQAFCELSQSELDGLIERVSEAAEHDLALCGEDLRLLLGALLMLTELQQRLSDQDITLHKLRKLAGIVRRDARVPDSIRHQAPLLSRFPNCEAAEDVNAIVQGLNDQP